MIRFTKAKAAPKRPKSQKNATLDKLKAYLTAAEPETVAALTSNLNGLQNVVTYKELREAYLAGGLTQAEFEKWELAYAKLVTSALVPRWDAAAQAGAQEVTARYSFLYEPSISVGLEFIRRHGAELVTNSAQEQINALNAIISHVSGYEMTTPDEAARIMRACVGLTKPQALANVRYREAVKQAYIKAHPHGKETTAEKKAADAAVRYAARQHRYRAQNIARTELAFAYNAGAYWATKDAQARGYIGGCVKVWLTAYDERVCPICSAMDDEKRNMDEAFSNGKLLPPAHPSCRCTVAYEEIPGTNLNSGGGLESTVQGERPQSTSAQPGQGASGIGSQKPGTIEQTGTVDFSDKSAVLQQLRQAQIDFAELDREMNCTVTSDGKVWRVSGTSGQVNPWGIEALGSSLRDSYSYHNHLAAQTWYSFSAEDIRFFFAAGESCAVAADDTYVYFMQRMRDTLDIDPEIAYHRFGEILNSDVRAAAWDGLISFEQDGYHETIKRLCSEFKIAYTRRRIDGT